MTRSLWFHLPFLACLLLFSCFAFFSNVVLSVADFVLGIVTDFPSDRIYKLGRYIESSPVLFLPQVITAGLIHGVLFGVSRRKLNPLWLILAFALFPMLNLFVEHVWQRRLIFPLLYAPVFVIGMRLSWRQIEQTFGDATHRNIVRASTIVFWVILLVPGFYLPPLYDGIAGWKFEVDPDSFAIEGTRIVFDDTSRAWFRPSFFHPITQTGRATNSISRRDPAYYRSNSFACFLQQLYAKAYPSAKEGLLPTQWRLGSFAYPPHSYDTILDASRYKPPEMVAGYEYVRIEFVEGTRRETSLDYWQFERGSC